MGGSDEQGRVDRLMTRNRQIAQIGEFIVNPLTFIHIRLSIITMTELKRIMYSEKHAEYIKQTRKRTTNDTNNECQYICLYNIRTMKLLS